MSSASAPRSPLTWSAHQVTWVYRFGEIPVLRSRFRVMQLEGHFLDRAGEEAPTLPSQARSRGVAGALVRSQVLNAPAGPVGMKDGMIRYLVNPAPRYWIDLSGTFADYTGKFSPKTRQTLGRKTRKVLGPMGATFHAYRTPEEMETFIQLARALSAKTYQERLLGVGFRSDPEFHAAILDRARSDRERGFLLLVGERPIAYLYTPESHPGVLSYDSLGYDPDFEQSSPGTVLQYLVVEHLFRGRGSTGSTTSARGRPSRRSSSARTTCAAPISTCYARPRPTWAASARASSSSPSRPPSCGPWTGSA